MSSGHLKNIYKERYYYYKIYNIYCKNIYRLFTAVYVSIYLYRYILGHNKNSCRENPNYMMVGYVRMYESRAGNALYTTFHLNSGYAMK